MREACGRVGIEGVSTHSFRRTALTQMSNAGIPRRIIQEISGHRTLDELYKYLEVSPDQIRGAIAALSMLTPTIEEQTYFGKPQSLRGRFSGGHKAFLWAWLDKYNDEDVRIAVQVISHWENPALSSERRWSSILCRMGRSHRPPEADSSNILSTPACLRAWT